MSQDLYYQQISYYYFRKDVSVFVWNFLFISLLPLTCWDRSKWNDMACSNFFKLPFPLYQCVISHFKCDIRHPIKANSRNKSKDEKFSKEDLRFLEWLLCFIYAQMFVFFLPLLKKLSSLFLLLCLSLLRYFFFHFSLKPLNSFTIS